MKKTNSIRFGGLWIAAGLGVGVLLPLILFLILGRILWLPVILGGVILAAFGIVFAVGMHQDSGSVSHDQKTLPGMIPFDPEKQTAVIRSSICTGEKVAGFKNKSDGHFTEVMLIRSPEDERRFKDMYRLDTVRTEY